MRHKALRKNKYGINAYLFTMLAFLIASFLFSCAQNKVTEIFVEESKYIPEPLNKFALEKATEVETNEETKAHHNYDQSFKLTPEKNIVIGEKQFLTKINYIYNHISEFADSTIEVEGMYGLYSSWDGTFNFPMVYRNGPSCHGDDQYGGFFLVNVPQELLNVNDWVEVKGVPFMYDHVDSDDEKQQYLFLLVEKIEKKPTKDRKAEMVNN